MGWRVFAGILTLSLLCGVPVTPGRAAPGTVAPRLAGASGAPTAVADSDALRSLGKLAATIAPGRSGAWSATGERGGLLLVNSDTPGAVRFYTTDWEGDLAAGRSVGVTVMPAGAGALSGAGLILRVTDGDPRWYAWIETPDGKVALYVRRPKELALVASFDIPDGRRPDGDRLEVDETGGQARLLVNGQVVTELRPSDGRPATVPAPVGIVALGTGQFSFSDFTFGGPVAATPSRTSGPDATPDGPTRGGPFRPLPSTPMPSDPVRTGTVDVPSLGPLGKDMHLGPDGAWTRSVEDGDLVYANETDNTDIVHRTRAWQGSAASGRSISMRAVSSGAAPDRGAGLVFAFGDNGNHFLALIVTPDGKAILYQFHDTNLDVVASLDLPAQTAGWGHLLQVSQKGDETSLLADGLLVKTLTPADGLDTSGDIGLVAMGTGRFAFRDFAYGGAVVPSRKRQGQADLPGLGPLGNGIRLERSGAWTKSAEDGHLLVVNDSDDHAYYYLTRDWPGSGTAGRTAGLRVQAKGSEGLSRGAGLAFGYADKGARALLWSLNSEGKVALYRASGDVITLLAAADVPGPRPPDGDLLEVSQTGDRTLLLANGAVVTTIAANDGRGLDTTGQAGIVLSGKGRYAFRDFTFGPLTPASAASTPPAAPGLDTDAAKLLVGNWHGDGEVAKAQFTSVSRYSPDGTFDIRRDFKPRTGDPYAIEMQGVWSAHPIDDTHIQIVLVPVGWTPQRVCPTPDSCVPIRLGTIRTPVQVVDHDTLRSEVGVTHRVD